MLSSLTGGGGISSSDNTSQSLSSKADNKHDKTNVVTKSGSTTVNGIDPTYLMFGLVAVAGLFFYTKKGR